MSGAKDSRRAIESYVHAIQRSSYAPEGQHPATERPATRPNMHHLTSLDWYSYTDDQIMGLAEMCCIEHARLAPGFQSDVDTEVGRRGLEVRLADQGH